MLQKCPHQCESSKFIRQPFHKVTLFWPYQPLDFPDPLRVNPRRPASAWTSLNGTGFHACPGLNYSQRTTVEVLKIIFSLKNVRRAPGDAGSLKRFSETIHETPTDFFVQRDGTVGFWPGSLHIVVSLACFVRFMTFADFLRHFSGTSSCRTSFVSMCLVLLSISNTIVSNTQS